MAITTSHEKTRLDILVENTGRVNFGHEFPNERAGITRSVTLGDSTLTGWQIFPLPLENVDALKYADAACIGACFYQASFEVGEPADTFVDTRQLGKGEVWINGHALGRFWEIGPQRTLYLPAPWLKKGRNEIVVFDLDGHAGRSIGFLDHAILGGKQ
jgi:beta-galactosidase